MSLLLTMKTIDVGGLSRTFECELCERTEFPSCQRSQCYEVMNFKRIFLKGAEP